MFHHIAGVDFNRCEKKTNCANCSEAQQRKCEKELDEAYINTAKVRIPAKRGERPFQEFLGHES